MGDKTKYFESQDDFNRSLEKAIKGSRIEQGKFKEALTSDQFAPLWFGATQPVFEEEYADLTLEQQYQKISTTELLNDFRPTQLYSIEGDDSVLPYDNGGKKAPEGTLPAVPELSPYPTFGYKAGGKWIDIPDKRGVRIQFSFEAFINDNWGLIERFPQDAADLAARTVDAMVFQLLVANGGLNTDNFNETNGTILLPYADTQVVTAAVPKNAPLSYDAIVAALHQIKTVKRRNRNVTVPGGFYLVVSPGMEELANTVLTSKVIERTEGNLKFAVDNVLSSSVEVLASHWISELGNEKCWFLVPKGGRTSARRTLLNLGLRGYETPELRVSNQTGLYLGGGDIPYTEGSFDNDDAEMRIRDIKGAALVNYDALIGSTGLGV